MAALRTAGTELYYASAALVATKIAGITSISGLGGATEQIDTTDFDDTDRTFVSGYGNPGQVTIDFIADPAVTSQSAMLTLKNSKELKSFGIYSSQAATAPTASGSVMQTVAGRSSWIFEGYVADVTFNFASNDVVKGQIVLQRSGTVAYTPVTA